MNREDYNLLLKDVEIFGAREIDEDDRTAYNPSDTFSEGGYKYIWQKNELSHEEIIEALLAKNLQQTKEIKQLLIFWTIIIVTGLVLLSLFRF